MHIRILSGTKPNFQNAADHQSQGSQVGLNIPSHLLSRVDRIGLFSAVRESGIGTKRTCRGKPILVTIDPKLRQFPHGNLLVPLQHDMVKGLKRRNLSLVSGWAG